MAVTTGYSPPHQKVDTKGRVEHLLVIAVGLDNLKLGNVDAAEREPERAVRGESSGTEGVTASPLLDTGNDLGETTVAESETKNDVGVGDVAGLGVVERKNEGGTGEAGGAVSTGLLPTITNTFYF